jgi:hypothetical protein
LPSASGSLKSSITVPIVGGAGNIVVSAATAGDCRQGNHNQRGYQERNCVLLFHTDSFRTVELKSEIISQNLDVASCR